MRPCLRGLLTASFHPQRRLIPALCPGTAPGNETAKCPESLCPTSVRPPLGRRGPPPRRALSLRHRSYGLMRQTRPALPSFGVLPRARSLRRLLPAPAASGFFPTLSLRVLPEMPGPLPRRFAGCVYLFLPLQHRPSPKQGWVGVP